MHAGKEGGKLVGKQVKGQGVSELGVVKLIMYCVQSGCRCTLRKDDEPRFCRANLRSRGDIICVALKNLLIV